MKDLGRSAMLLFGGRPPERLLQYYFSSLIHTKWYSNHGKSNYSNSIYVTMRH